MWNVLPKTNVLITFNGDNDYDIFITDFIKLWLYSASKEDFVHRIKLSNVDLENISEEKMLLQVQHMLQRPYKVHSNVSFSEESASEQNMNVKLLMATEYGYPIKLDVDLVKCSEQKTVTLPLMSIVKDLTQSQDELFEIMAKKDREIEEYKLEGGRLGLKYLKSPSFNQSEHICKYNRFAKSFGSSDILANVLLHKGTTTENGTSSKIIKREPLSKDIVKQEVTEEIVKAEIPGTILETAVKEENPVTEFGTPRKKRKTFLNM